MGIRPSPDPRSYTTSAGVTCARSSIASTTFCGVGTYLTSGVLRCLTWATDGAMRRAATAIPDISSCFIERAFVHGCIGAFTRTGYAVALQLGRQEPR